MDTNQKPIDQLRFKIQRVANVNNCSAGHHTHYRLITTDGLSSFCMICFALGWFDNTKNPLELVGRTKLPDQI